MSKNSNKITAALGLLIVFSIGGAYLLTTKDIEQDKETKNVLQQSITTYGTYQTPELAYQECQKILINLSNTLNSTTINSSSKNK